MKRIVLYLTVLAVGLFCAGCQIVTAQKSEDHYERPEYQLSVESKTEKEKCFVCSDQKDNMMAFYTNRDSVGIIHWNNMYVTDTEVRAYDDRGNELFGQDHTSIRRNSFGDGYGSVTVAGMPNRGYSDTRIYYEDKDEVDFNLLKDSLCQSCLDKVVKFYVDQKNHGDDIRLGTTGYCLVDFVTRELYTLSDPYRGYSIRDYFVRFDIVEDPEGTDDRIELFLFYAPERTLEKDNEK